MHARHGADTEREEATTLDRPFMDNLRSMVGLSPSCNLQAAVVNTGQKQGKPPHTDLNSVPGKKRKHICSNSPEEQKSKSTIYDRYIFFVRSSAHCHYSYTTIYALLLYLH